MFLYLPIFSDHSELQHPQLPSLISHFLAWSLSASSTTKTPLHIFYVLFTKYHRFPIFTSQYLQLLHRGLRHPQPKTKLTSSDPSPRTCLPHQLWHLTLLLTVPPTDISPLAPTLNCLKPIQLRHCKVTYRAIPSTTQMAPAWATPWDSRTERTPQLLPLRMSTVCSQPAPLGLLLP
ncbi:uncharacterized protein CTRU02_206158 [Colletotrichum truncatum]|uniref:Uncharacterized protein n=1 Tax=Colletotrichum truncatum TaxID=5467 RepID=A0ACC3Z624_COLTU|nr:uncharacterized protein CTRU02_10424 [Colletotrichum truncatum]KAF6787161.1 hypothetical protein CTRU02_10424 [Colletotrichum truncatum]